MLLRFLTLALIVAFSFTLFAVTANADFSGIFDNTTRVGGLDADFDDFDEALRRLRPTAATDSSAVVFDASAPPTPHLPLVFSGAGPMSRTGRLPIDRGPPAGFVHVLLAPSLEPPAIPRPCSERNTPWPA